MMRLLACLLLGLTPGGRFAMAVEEPTHSVLLHDGAFGLRDYPARVVAEVHVTGSQFEAGGSGFGLLASYIFGGNAGGRHIATPAPVAQSAAGTSPVSRCPDAQDWTVRFFMPNGAALATLPATNDAQMRLRSCRRSVSRGCATTGGRRRRGFGGRRRRC